LIIISMKKRGEPIRQSEVLRGEHADSGSPLFLEGRRERRDFGATRQEAEPALGRWTSPSIRRRPMLGL
jgi:hypothetical protein